MKVPELDKMIGISVYSTDLKGIGGKIKFSYDSFVVEEIISDVRFKDNGYAFYILEKEGIDSQHVLEDIFKRYRLRLRVFGLKDSYAKTKQYAIAIDKGSKIDEIKGYNYTLRFLGYVEPLTKDILIANRFKVIIKDHKRDPLDTLERIKGVDIANFYGYQRFGYKNPTHVIGREIIKKAFKKAVELLIDNSNSKDYEYYVRLEFEKGKDPIRALRCVPINIRRLFVDAYKAYLFNKILSKAIEDGYYLRPREGDIVYVDNKLEVFRGQKHATLAIPTPGYGFNSKTRFLPIIECILREEGISNKDFFVKEVQEVSSASGFRQALLSCKDLLYRLEPLTLEFTLQKGGYATILLREIIKPEDPLEAGFLN